MISRRILLTGAGGAWAQFKADVRVVNVLASVRDKRGAIISDLTKDDFTLQEQGRPQTIQYFARQGELPLTLGLLVDTSMSQERVIMAQRIASLRFLDQVLRVEKDKACVVQFDSRVLIRQMLTNDYNKLEGALSLVDTPTRQEQRHGIGGGTVLYDAIDTTARILFKDAAGRKALIVLTDGMDFGSSSTLGEAIDAAQKNDTLVYSILFTDGNGLNGRRALKEICHETGGAFYEVSKRTAIDRIYELIQNELRNQYSLGYVSDSPPAVSEFRKIELSTKQKGLVVQARERYWARP